MRRSAFLGFLVGVNLLLPTGLAHASHAYVGYKFNGPGSSSGNRVNMYVWSGNYDAALAKWLARATENVDDSWNRYTNFWFDYRGAVNNGHSTSYNVNVVTYEYIDGSRNRIGTVFYRWCPMPVICQTHTHLEEAGTVFYRGGSAAIPLNQADLWSLVAHEVGHSIRLEDLSDADAACPSGAARATMCTPLYVGNGTTTGNISSVRNPNTTEDIRSANAAAVPNNP